MPIGSAPLLDPDETSPIGTPIYQDERLYEPPAGWAAWAAPAASRLSSALLSFSKAEYEEIFPSYGPGGTMHVEATWDMVYDEAHAVPELVARAHALEAEDFPVHWGWEAQPYIDSMSDPPPGVRWGFAYLLEGGIVGTGFMIHTEHHSGEPGFTYPPVFSEDVALPNWNGLWGGDNPFQFVRFFVYIDTRYEQTEFFAPLMASAPGNLYSWCFARTWTLEWPGPEFLTGTLTPGLGISGSHPTVVGFRGGRVVGR